MGSAPTTVTSFAGRWATTPALRMGGPGTGVWTAAGALAISAMGDPPREARLLPGTDPAASLSTTASRKLLAERETGLNWVSVSAAVPSGSRGGARHTAVA